MHLRRFVIALVTLGLWSLLGIPTMAQEQHLPSEHHSVAAASAVPVESFHRVDTDALRADVEAQENGIGPYRFATDLDTDVSPVQHGTWERLSSDKWLWRLRIRSKDAVSLNLAFTEYRLPEGSELYVYSPEKNVTHGPYKKKDATKGQLWTPVVPGSEVIVELTVPVGRRSDLGLHLTQVNHGFRSIRSTRSKRATAKARACNIDVACPQAFPWWDQVRSAGLYSVGGTDLCSGSLINNTNQDGTPYFLTAEHCLEGSEEQASSMVFYWNYEHPTCRRPDSTESGAPFTDKPEQTSSGATLRMSYGNVETQDQIAGKPDITLVEIDEPLPQAYKLYLSGWDRRDFAPSEAVSIHHPQTHAKRITFENDQTSVEGYFGGSSDTHIHVNWDDGTTEGGSSGSPLFAPSEKIVGVLSGGESGCEIEDWYGRLHNAWEGGGSPDTRLRDWLDPNNSGVETLDGYDLANDASSPSQVPDFTVANATDSTITLSWTAPGDDRMTGTAEHYDLRYRTDQPISSRSDFRTAHWVHGVPAPDTAGTRQSVTIDVSKDTSYYFGLVALDRVLNSSRLATIDGDITPVQDINVSSPSPNPARNRTTVSFAVEDRQQVNVRLFDVLGRRVQTVLIDTIDPFRRRDVRLDVSSLSSGIYFLNIQGENVAETKKIAVVK